jgi:TonB family protein
LSRKWRDIDDEAKAQEPRRLGTALPKAGIGIVTVALLISAILHLASGYNLSGVRNWGAPPRIDPRNTVKIHINDKRKDKEKLKEPEPPKPKEEDLASKKILEMPQTKTEAPDEPDHLGTVDHKALKETRVSEKLKRDKAKDPGQKGKPVDQKQVANVNPDQPQQPKPAAPKEKSANENAPKKNPGGSLSMESYRPKPRNDYEALLPTNVTDLPGQLTAGYQDYVDDKVQEGDRIDINTSEYRYIGYFTAMRKAIELVWNYPMEAVRKGMAGEVVLEFAINKDGKASHIKVVKSSGYEILDRTMVDTIRLASPFSPLPQGFKKERIVVTGAFRYILSAYGSH